RRITLSNAMSITPEPPLKTCEGRLKHGSILNGNIRLPRVSSQWKSTAGLSTVDLCRMYGVSDATFCKWRSKHGGMDVAEAKRHRAKHGRSRRRVRHIDVVSGMRQCRRQSDKHG
ncbi:MAG: transposase, partial [Alphaproteobacteria bacterium]|nr:transposase [Rhizobiaceae bacterium]MBU3963297.1 transposase [Alphaproteobacteria bacterium]MBU4048899.1 transposase [Alphaproteobacteria bacterium]MBU4090320.1 transposase [Alphaproteobacteria bacterium]MBU4158748.1 transposase [Alphaproteobacteria bacterium]